MLNMQLLLKFKNHYMFGIIIKIQLNISLAKLVHIYLYNNHIYKIDLIYNFSITHSIPN